jgi:hypothetical protein
MVSFCPVCQGRCRLHPQCHGRAKPGHDGVDGSLTASMCQSWVVELTLREPSHDRC